MVTNVTNFSRSGLYDWMAQRVSAVVLAAFFLFLLGFLVANPGLTYADWHGLFAKNWMRIFSLLAIVFLRETLKLATVFAVAAVIGVLSVLRIAFGVAA